MLREEAGRSGCSSVERAHITEIEEDEVKKDALGTG